MTNDIRKQEAAIYIRQARAALTRARIATTDTARICWIFEAIQHCIDATKWYPPHDKEQS